MFFGMRRMIAAILGGVVMIGLLTGCVTVTPGPGTAAPTATMALPTIPVDTSKSIDEQMTEIKTGFAKVYCPVRNTPLASAIAEEGKGLWNDLANRAKAQGVIIPTFDPGDPQICQGK